MAENTDAVTFDGYHTTHVVTGNHAKQIETRFHLAIDVDSLIRQLTAVALTADRKPRQAGRVNGAVVLTILEEDRQNT